MSSVPSCKLVNIIALSSLTTRITMVAINVNINYLDGLFVFTDSTVAIPFLPENPRRCQVPSHEIVASQIETETN